MFTIDLKLDFGKVMDAIRKEEERRLARDAFQVRAIAQAKTNVPNPKGRHARHGSTPPNPPYKRTGRLRGSILYKVNKEAMTADIGILHKAQGFYGNMQEFGYLNGKKQVPARPFMRPSLVEFNPRLAGTFGNLI